MVIGGKKMTVSITVWKNEKGTYDGDMNGNYFDGLTYDSLKKEIDICLDNHKW